MNDRTAGAILLVIGVIAIFAAIVGGGIKIQQIEVGSVQSKWRQWLLGAFGLIIGLVGLIMVWPNDPPTNAVDSNNVAVPDDNGVGTDDNAAGADDNGTDPNVTGENADAASADEPNQDAATEDNTTAE